MKTSKIFLMTTLIICLGIGFLPLNMHAGDKDVNVVNTPNVHVTNTPNVNVTNTVPVTGNVGISGTPNVVVLNPDSQPIPVFNTKQPEKEPFQTSLVYDQIAGTFPVFTAPAGKRVVIQNMSWVALVPLGKTPVGFGNVFASSGTWVLTVAPVWTHISVFFSVQDRFTANLPTLFYLEPGATFVWGVKDSAGEDPFSPLMSLNTSLCLTGYVVNLVP